MNSKGTLFIFGQQASMLKTTKEILKEYFSEIHTFLEVELLISSLNKLKPQFILFGGAVPEAVRETIKIASRQSSSNIKFIEPHGPSEIISAVLKAKT